VISHKYRCVFIHQRKAAGSAIIRAFGFTPRQPEWGTFNEGVLGPEWSVKDRLAPGYRTFIVIRNPWDRVVSGWRYLAATRVRSLREVLQDLPREGHDYRHLTRPQLDTVLDAGGRFVPDYVLRYEHLEQDYVRLCRILGKRTWWPRLQRVNATRHRPYQEYYDAETVEMVRDLFRKDIEFFGYDFGTGALNIDNLGGKLLA
jgi:hypothetical protein